MAVKVEENGLTTGAPAAQPPTADAATPAGGSFAGPTIAWMSALALCGLVPVIVIANTPSDGDSAWWLALVLTLVAGARFSWMVGVGQPRLMEFSFWTFTYVFMALAPLVQMRTGNYPNTTGGLTTALNHSSMIVTLVGVGAVAASSVMPRSAVGRWRPSRPEQLSAVRTLLLAGVALAFNAFYVLTIGPSTFLESRAALHNLDVTTNASLNSIVGAMARVPLLVAFLAVLVLRRSNVGSRRRWLTLLASVICGAALFTVNPISSARYVFGTFALAILAGLGAYATPARVRVMTVGFLIGLVGVFPIADAFRRSAVASVDLASDTNPLIALSTGDYDAFGQLNNTLLYVHEAGITWGRQALGVILFWVPRDVWPSKPIDTGTLLAEFRGYEFGNLSAPLWAEFYINFGIVGLILGMLLLGLYMRRSDLRASALLRAGSAPPIISLVLPFYLILLLRGSLLQAMAFLSVLCVCVLFVRGEHQPVTSVGGPRSQSAR